MAKQRDKGQERKERPLLPGGTVPRAARAIVTAGERVIPLNRLRGKGREER